MDEFESVNEEQVINSGGTDFSNMSDEEFAALEPSFLDQDFGDAAQEGGIAGSEQEIGDGSYVADDSESVDSGTADDADDEGDGEASLSDSADPAAEAEADEAGDAEQGDPEGETGAVDYKTEYEKLLAPFRANGKELQVRNVDEAIQLMQMGANYNKKMSALKPNLKMLKLLENNGMLSEEKINFLIDLDKKNPEAIKKLVKDSGLDPLDIDLNDVSEYTPERRTVDDRELELDSVLEEIKDTPTYRETLNVVTSKWDGPSKQIVAQEPQLLKVINDHMASGVYQLISQEIESERVFGRLNGLSDLEAYRQVGDAINARGGFDHLFRREQPAAPERIVPPAPKKADDGQLKGKKRAASSTRLAPGSTTEPTYNPLAMSDAEFERLVNERLM